MSNTPLLQDIQAYTAKAIGTYTQGPYNNVNQRGVAVGVNITAGAGNVTVTIQGVDASGTAFTLLASAALSGAGFTQLIIYPGAAASANLIANAPLPPTWQIKHVVAGNTLTYTLSYYTIN